MMNEDEVEKRMKELGLDIDSLEEFVDALKPLVELSKKYKPEYLEKMLQLSLEIIGIGTNGNKTEM